MLVLTNATYPSSETKKAIQVFSSPDLPKRPDSAKEIGSFVYTDAEGNHTLFLLQVDDARVREYLDAQVQRNVYFTTRVPGSRIDVHFGHSVMEAITLATKQLP